ncbi:MAG: hypothetical protein ACJ71Z_13580 [Aeromicrobium sp.]
MPAARSVAATLLVTALTACGGTTPVKPADHAPGPTATRTAHAFHVGEAQRSHGVSTTLLEVDYPYTGDEKHRPDPGAAFIGLVVRTCLDAKAPSATLTARNSEWSIGNHRPEYSGARTTSWTDWPLPKYPEYAKLAPGQCRQGWLLLAGPADERFTTVTYRPSGGRDLTWVGTFIRD